MQALKQWVRLLTQSELPVLKQTARDLLALKAADQRNTIIEIAHITARDPIMTVKLLRYLQQHKRMIQTTEILQIEQALIMMGVEPFFNHVAPKPLVEDQLAEHKAALPPVLRVIHRVHRASQYAKEWAVHLRDLHFEEVRVAALLHDIAEILLWCFAPDEMQKIYQIQHENRNLRSRDVQIDILGFPIVDLQREIAEQWRLPTLLLMLMDDSKAQHPRVQNVILAVNLARHSANGWDDAALDDDYIDIARLLRLSSLQVKQLIIKTEPHTPLS